MSHMTDKEITELIERSKTDEVQENVIKTETTADITPTTVRKLMVIGCGDGGCNIATAIAKKIPNESFVIAYNTSTRNISEVFADTVVMPKHEDGSGKEREYSKQVFRGNVHKELMNVVKSKIAENNDISYIIVCTTTDGGTGSGISPMAAKLLSDNFDIPVIMMGVYPSMSEDATSQYNALQWQMEVNKIGIPYFVLDNNQPGIMKHMVHNAVNEQAAMIASLLAGNEFGNTNISIIDNRNLYMLMIQLGNRLVAMVDTTRPSAGQSLDDYVDTMLSKCYQPDPTNVRGIGIFIKGPADMLGKMDTSIPEIQKKYGNAVLHFAHIEEGTEPKIAILMTGCSESAARLSMMKSRYDDIMHASNDMASASVLSGIMGGMQNPLGTSTKKVVPSGADADMSALEL